ncbi:DUF3352 domain-containing protein [Scytonema hofmannii FACHB-248]|uniref:DUF3352 domain-containing protein n=1 Tax=Scytonema hofmannii FACHB-248 TaxID=1842502 RepID=A0ABR8GKS4_9CYAN|nr:MULTISPECIES: DUF3352 domain-containing protein [Nostocales]MBD2603992.1 DUF3352 domain-containing protein [Scytonema hofmannii FACHB-248]
MRQNSLFGFLAAGAIALLLIIIAGFYWFFGKSPVNLIGGGTASEPGAAIFVSKRAPVMLSMLINPDKLEASSSDRELSKLKTSLLANTGIDYKKDVQPWLGNEITLAVTTLDIDRDAANGLQTGYLMALFSNQPEKSREFVELLFSKRAIAGENLVVEQYEGVKLISDTSPSEKGLLAGASVGDFILFANDPKVLRDAINNVQAPDLNLTNSLQYQKALKQLPKDSLAAAFLNLPAIAEWQNLKLSEATYDSQIVSLALNPKGLLAETSFLASSATSPPFSQLSQPVTALEYIPETAGLAISGVDLSNLDKSDLAQLWKQLTTAISGSQKDVTSSLVQPFADVEKAWGIDLRRDIFSWVKGEYAIALLPHEQQINPDWVFVVEKTEGVPLLISQLDAIASSQGLNVNSLTLDNQKIFAWTKLTTVTNNAERGSESINLKTKAQGVHTSLGNYEIFTSSIDVMNQILKIKDNSLVKNRNFQDSIAAIPQPNQGYLYLDWAKSHQIVERQIPILKLVEVVAKPYLDKVRSLIVSSYGSDNGLLKGGIFFELHHS